MYLAFFEGGGGSDGDRCRGGGSGGILVISI
jgi:hypothetical protein